MNLSNTANPAVRFALSYLFTCRIILLGPGTTTRGEPRVAERPALISYLACPASIEVGCVAPSWILAYAFLKLVSFGFLFTSADISLQSLVTLTVKAAA
jgi:hypothetical protein